MDAPRVAIISYVTHSRHLNYGATLHGWAFQQVLERMGCRSVVIDYLPRDLEGHQFKWPMLGVLKTRIWRHPVIFARRFATWLVSSFANRRKWCKFRAFFRERLVCTGETYTERSLCAAKDIDGLPISVFVVEADVTWKYRLAVPLDRGFFLDFPAADGRRKVAYAPSVSKKDFPPEAERRFREYVRGFDAVSSRERTGAKRIAEMTDVEVEYMPDPTLLLDAEDYAAIAKPPSMSGYVLLYTCAAYDGNMIREAKKYAKRLGKRLVEVGNFGINRFIFGHKVIDDAGVEEWLGLFMNADAVVCNSFHGICFSLVFRKPFFSFKRREDDWRFTGICDEYKLGHRLVDRGGAIPEDAEPIDFDNMQRLLARDRERAFAFIRDNIARPAAGTGATGGIP